MKYFFIIFIVLFLCIGVFAQSGDQVLSIRDFKGLNTRDGDFTIKPNEFRVLHNFDLGELGSIKKRKGYSPYVTFTGVDSLIGLYNAVYSDASTELIVLTDPDTLGYGHLMKWDPSGSFTRVDTVWIIRDTSGVGRNIWFFGNYGAIGFSLLINGADTTTTMSFLVDAVSDSITTLMTGLTITSADSTTYAGASPDSGFVVVSYDTTGATQGFSLTNFYYPTNQWNVRTVTTNTATSVQTTIFPHFSVQSQPTFSMYKNDVYISNGHQKMIIWTGDRAKEVPTPAPSEPRIIPVVSSTGSRLDGMFRYIIQALVFDTTADDEAYFASYLSSPIRVDSGHVLLTGFHTPAKRFADGTDTVATIDSLELHIYRLKTTQAKFDEVDTAIGIKVLKFSSDGSFYDTTFIDSMPADSFVAPNLLPILDLQPAKRDSNDVISYRYGAPTFLDNVLWTPTIDTIGGPVDVDSIGLFWYGDQHIERHVGYAYVCTIYDTLTGAESDTGRSLWAFRTADTVDLSFTIGLPPIPDSLLDTRLNVYRTKLITSGHNAIYYRRLNDTLTPLSWEARDSLAKIHCTSIEPGKITESKYGTFQLPPVSIFNQECYDKAMADFLFGRRKGIDYKRIAKYIIDSVYASIEWRRLGFFPRGTEFIVDILRQDSLDLGVDHPAYISHDAPALLEGVVPLNDNLWGYTGSRVYLSDDELGTMWDKANNIAINLNDGDSVTMMFPARGVMEIFKQNSKVNVFEDMNLFWNRTEVSGFFGSIATKSHAASLRGNYYLSNDGVILETEGQFRDRSVATNLLSQKLDNFDKLTNAQKFSAVGFSHDHKYMLSVPAVGTTYVYDEIANGWSTWGGLVFQDATLRGDTMLFIKGSNVYSYGTSEFDAGNVINMTFTTPPLFPDPNFESIHSIALWRRNGDTASTLPIRLFDGSTNTASRTFDSLFKRVTIKGFSSNESPLPYFIGGNPTFNLSTAIIDGFDIYYTRNALVREE